VKSYLEALVANFLAFGAGHLGFVGGVLGWGQYLCKESRGYEELTASIASSSVDEVLAASLRVSTVWLVQ
jgi:hypothetical protein